MTEQSHRRKINKSQKIIDFLCDSNNQDDLFFSPSIACQTNLPPCAPEDMKNPLPNPLEWECIEGRASLKIKAGEVYNPIKKTWVSTGLPHGMFGRLTMLYINKRAKQANSPIVFLEKNLNSYLKTLNVSNNGPNYQEARKQLLAVLGSEILYSFCGDTSRDSTGSKNRYMRIAKAIDLQFSTNDPDRLEWPDKLILSDEYFSELQRAVPLNERAIQIVKNSPFQFDFYVKCVECLPRLKKPMFLTWASLYDRYGHNYSRCGDFRRRTGVPGINKVKALYPESSIDFAISDKGRPLGVWLKPSPPAIAIK